MLAEGETKREHVCAYNKVVRATTIGIREEKAWLELSNGSIVLFAQQKDAHKQPISQEMNHGLQKHP